MPVDVCSVSWWLYWARNTTPTWTQATGCWLLMVLPCYQPSWIGIRHELWIPPIISLQTSTNNKVRIWGLNPQASHKCCCRWCCSERFALNPLKMGVPTYINICICIYALWSLWSLELSSHCGYLSELVYRLMMDDVYHYLSQDMSFACSFGALNCYSITGSSSPHQAELFPPGEGWIRHSPTMLVHQHSTSEQGGGAQSLVRPVAVSIASFMF